jgi:hypothetical protein
MVKNLRPFIMTENITARPIVMVKKTYSWSVDMSGNPSRKKSLLFKVLWEGYSDDDFTWEPWANVRKNVFLTKFLRKHPNKKVQALEPKNLQSIS